MLLAIDLDGVVFDTMQSWLRKYHPDSNVDDILGWDAFDYIPTCSGVGQFFKELDSLEADDIIVNPFAVSGIKQLEKDHEVYFLTNKTKPMMKWTTEILERVGLGHIKLVNSLLEKKDKLEYEFDYLLDDHPKLAGEFRVVTYDQPYNKDEDTLYRAYNMNHFVKMIDGLLWLAK